MSSNDELRERIATALRGLDIDARMADLDDDNDVAAVADVAITAIQGAYVPPPPGSDRDALPGGLRALVAPHLTDYLSTACETASACKFAAEDNPDRSDELRTWGQREHASCRQTRKQDMAACACPCHREGT